MNQKSKKNPKSKSRHTGQMNAKKAAVLGTGPKRINGRVIGGLLALVIIATGAFLWLQPAPQKGAVTAQTAAPVPSAGLDYVTYPVDMFADGKVRHFSFKDGALTIRYFILKSADGVIRAAFDACDVCWPAGKGYYQDGDVMVCRNCGRRFVSVKVNEVKGGCNPAPLTRQVKNGQLIITHEDLRKGRGYFDFSGKA